MEAKNFRVGNLIKSKEWGGNGQIEGIEKTKEGFELKVMGYVHSFIGEKAKPKRYFDLEPIKLDTDWLMKLGFKKQSNTYWISLYNLKAELHFEDYKHDMVLWLKSNNSNLILDPIKYVHQLQNLFFALSNEELELKNDCST